MTKTTSKQSFTSIYLSKRLAFRLQYKELNYERGLFDEENRKGSQLKPMRTSVLIRKAVKTSKNLTNHKQ